MSQNLKEHQKAVHANIKDKQCEHCYNYTGRRDALKKHLESRRNTFELPCENHILPFHSDRKHMNQRWVVLGMVLKNKGTFDFCIDILSQNTLS